MFRLAALLFFLGFISCSNEEVNIVRPKESWVFRSVLDSVPRALTLALSDNMYAAYSTENCSLYKVWKGNVVLQGAVYTEAHGPQPISTGPAYTINRIEKPWTLQNNAGENLNTTVQYLGHKIVGNKASMSYRLTAEQNSGMVELEEYVDYSEKEGMPVFQRTFTITKSNPDLTPILTANYNGIIVKQNLTTNGALVINKTEEIIFNGRAVIDIEISLKLNKEGQTFLNAQFLHFPTLVNRNDELLARSNSSSRPMGEMLVENSDCSTCHNPLVKTVGPAYLDIAKKYNNDPATIEQLSAKIINGGSGVWGNQAMTPHPAIALSSAAEMVKYILSFSSSGGENSNSGRINKIDTEPLDFDQETLLQGAIVTIYDLPGNVNSAVAVPTSSKPKFAGVLPAIANISGTGFKELLDNFGLLAKGYFHAPEDGDYAFEITSDDGSILYIGEQLLITNDGPHGTESKLVSVPLKKGYYPFTLKYYQGGGGKYLSLAWKKPSDSNIAPIPSEYIFHQKSDQNQIQGLSLPMANAASVPGDGQALKDVHPSFNLAQARPADFQPKVGGMDFLSDGRLVVCTWDTLGAVYVIENAQTGNPSVMRFKRIAMGLAEPLGLKVVDDTIYVMQKQELTKLVDLDGDEQIDEFRTVANSWGVTTNFHEFAFGLDYKDGYFYATLATDVEPGGASSKNQPKDRGSVIKVEKNSGKVQYIAKGFRTPNGIAFGHDGELFMADNQGDWLPSSKINHVVEGEFYGHRSVDSQAWAGREEKWPVVWLPQDEIGNSPSTPLALNVGPYRNQMIHGEVTHGGIKRVFVEKVDEQYQGCVFRFIQGLEAGVNRMVWGPDSALYVGGVGNPGNWSHEGNQWYGLQKLTYNSKSAFEMLSIKSKANGFEIEFTEPLRTGDGWKPTDYTIKQWQYIPTVNYGGPKVNEQIITIKNVSVSPDRKKVFLELQGLKPKHVVYFHLKGGFISELGNSMWTTESWYTQNSISTDLGQQYEKPAGLGENMLTEDEKAQGWSLLFDGANIDGFKTYNSSEMSNRWTVTNGSLHFNPTIPGEDRDLITKEKYKDFELQVDWKVGLCGNSGIMFNVVEDPKYAETYLTGPEFQIIDNICHPDSKYKKHKAGDLYDLVESKYAMARPAGEWNRTIIRSKDGRVDFYVNGQKTVSVAINDAIWARIISQSKFKDMADFGKADQGHIALQAHGDPVWFKNIKIRKL